MTTLRRAAPTRWIAALACVALLPPLHAQTPGAPGSPPPAASTQAAAPASATFSQAELDQLVAPIALYPDALLAQVLMASTYPLEVVEADRWVKANPGLKDKALEDALQQQKWDPSVKSLAVFPQVLTMMSEKLDWTQKLGDAFLAQQKEVLATAQTLRSKASAQGALKDTQEQKVITTQENNTTVIKIEPTNPEVVYVPSYNPTVVYGAWPYPAYPPYAYYPPGYVAGGALLGFTAGVIVGGALWGGVGWGRGDVDINVNRYNNFNKTNINNGNWKHNAEHRGAVPYRDQGVAKQNGRGQAADAASRDAFRGHADAGRQQIQRGEVAAPRSSQMDRGGAGAGDRGGAGAANRPSGGAGGNYGGAGGNYGGAGGNYGGSGNRGGYSGASAGQHDMSGRGSSAFDTRSASQARSSSSRGASSMNSSMGAGNMSRGGGGGGGARGGGGGGRGGGGRR